MNDAQCKAILDAIIDCWWQKILDKMLSENKDFDEALEEVKQEILND